MLVADRLTELRKAKGASKRELSLHLGLEQSTYGKYEQGLRRPSLEVLRGLADYFDVSADYLLGNDQPLVIPEALKGVRVAFDRGEFEDLTQDEVDALAVIADKLKAARRL